MIEGKFIETNKPIVQASVAWNQIVQSPYFLLDTGFTGDLVVPLEVAKDLGVQLNGVTTMKTADNKAVPVMSGTAYGVMEGNKIYITLLVSDGMPLFGISFMEKFGYTAIIECKKKTVVLQQRE